MDYLGQPLGSQYFSRRRDTKGAEIESDGMSHRPKPMTPWLLRKATRNEIPGPDSGAEKLKYCSKCERFREGKKDKSKNKTRYLSCACDEVSPHHSDKVQYSDGTSKGYLEHDKYYLFEVSSGSFAFGGKVVSWCLETRDRIVCALGGECVR